MGTPTGPASHQLQQARLSPGGRGRRNRCPTLYGQLIEATPPHARTHARATKSREDPDRELQRQATCLSVPCAPDRPRPLQENNGIHGNKGGEEAPRIVTLLQNVPPPQKKSRGGQSSPGHSGGGASEQEPRPRERSKSSLPRRWVTGEASPTHASGGSGGQPQPRQEGPEQPPPSPGEAELPPAPGAHPSQPPPPGGLQTGVCGAAPPPGRTCECRRRGRSRRLRRGIRGPSGTDGSDVTPCPSPGRKWRPQGVRVAGSGERGGGDGDGAAAAAAQREGPGGARGAGRDGRRFSACAPLNAASPPLSRCSCGTSCWSTTA